MTNRPVRVALAGTSFGRVHARAYSILSGRGEATLAAVCSGSAEGARRLAGEFAIPVATSDYASILTDSSIDAVDLCVPHHLHAPMAIAAARAGKHILVEKPIATSLDEADAMIAAARTAGVVLMVAHNQRYYGQIARLKALLDGGAIGRPFLVVATVLVHGQISGYRASLAESGGGALIDSGAHRFDLLRWILGEIESVSAETGRMMQLQMEGEDSAVVSLRFRSGAIGSFSCCWSAKAPVPEEGLAIFGTKGSLVAEDKSRRLRFRLDEPAPGLDEFGEIAFDIDHADSVALLIADFVACLREGRQPSVTGEDSRAALALTLASYRSAREGTKVQL